LYISVSGTNFHANMSESIDSLELINLHDPNTNVQDGVSMITNPFKLMDLPDDMLKRILRTVPVCEDIFAIVSRLKSANQRFLKLVRLEMQQDQCYQKAVRDLYFATSRTLDSDPV